MSTIAARWAALSTNARRGIVGGGLGVLAISLIGIAVLAGGGESEEAAPTTIATTTTTTEAPTTTTEPPVGPVAPLTGLRVADDALLGRPALAIKIDNLDAPSESALPQAGLNRADVVFEEIVEGNITRLVAVYHSQQPGRVGPVRSARTTDVQILPQFGRVLLGWSGGNDGVVAAVRSSPSIIDAGWDAVPGSYARDRSRRAPHNLFTQADELWSRAPEDAGPPPPLFLYRTEDQELQPTAQASAGVDISWGGGIATAPAGWRWDPELRLYLRTQQGRPHMDDDGTQVVATNVVVLATEYGQSPADARSPEALTVGSGELFAFTEGHVIYGRWDRPDVDRPASLVDADGAPVLLTPGTTWIELPRPGGTTAILS